MAGCRQVGGAARRVAGKLEAGQVLGEIRANLGDEVALQLVQAVQRSAERPVVVRQDKHLIAIHCHAEVLRRQQY